MRVSIWQQWSSNHSAAFTIMAKFSTVEDAQRAGNLAQDILRQVATWKYQDAERQWQAHLKQANIENPTDRDEMEFKSRLHRAHTTEIETQLTQQYGVTWPLTIDYAREPALAPRAVLVVDRAVIVDEGLIDYYTWTGPSPFAELLAKWGGATAYFVEGGTGNLIRVLMTCLAPNEAIAAQLAGAVEHRSNPYDPTSTEPEEMRISDLQLPGTNRTHWVNGHITRDGLRLTYDYIEDDYGRYFADLIAYLQTHGCAQIDYDFSTESRL